MLRVQLAAACLCAAFGGALAEDENSVVLNDSPDLGCIRTAYDPQAGTLSLSFGADILASLPLNVGRTELTVLKDPVNVRCEGLLPRCLR